MPQEVTSVAVYCGSSVGKHPAFAAAAKSLGHALAETNRTLVYGGGSKGIMGSVSAAALERGGKVIGVIPSAMVAAGGEEDKLDTKNDVTVRLDEPGREAVETIIVDSMHERKVQMAMKANGFIGLPGGFGTFEEVLEVTTWTQLGIHAKPVVILNVLSFWEPLRALVKGGIEAGFIRPSSERLIIFVDGPENPTEHESHDWGNAALDALDNWQSGDHAPLFNWNNTGDKSMEYKET